jgi:hypothetical protein
VTTYDVDSIERTDTIRLDPKGGVYLKRCGNEVVLRLRPWLLDVTAYATPFGLFSILNPQICGIDVGSRVYVTYLTSYHSEGSVGRFDPQVSAGSTYPAEGPEVQTAVSASFSIAPTISTLAPLAASPARTTTVKTSLVAGGFEVFRTPSQHITYEIAASPCSAFFSEGEGMLGRWRTSAEEPVQDLQSVVNTFVDGGVLNSGQGNSLSVKLDHALSALNSGQNKVAQNVLGAFINETTGLVNGRVLSSSQGDQLISPANAIIVGCTFQN